MGTNKPKRIQRKRLPEYLREAFIQFPNVRSDREIMSGAPCVGGRRIPVWVIAGRFAAGETIGYIAQDYGISRKTVTTAIRFVCWTSQLSKIKFWKFEEIANG